MKGYICNLYCLGNHLKYHDQPFKGSFSCQILLFCYAVVLEECTVSQNDLNSIYMHIFLKILLIYKLIYKILCYVCLLFVYTMYSVYVYK